VIWAPTRKIIPIFFKVLVGLLYFLSINTAALDLRGDWQQGGLILGSVRPGTKITFEGRQVDVSPEGHFMVALGRDAPSQVTLTLNDKGVINKQVFTVAQRKYDVQKVEGVPQETVEPPPEVLDRIAREAALVASARSGSDPRLDYLAGFTRPLEGRISGVYGSQRYYNGIPRNPHYGLDIAAPTGALVRAPAAGIVRLAHPDLYFSGGTLIVDHGYGLFSSFIHLSDILVATGQAVAAGDEIARVGATGRATGPHLDWRINWFDVRIDPALVLKSFPRAAEE